MRFAVTALCSNVPPDIAKISPSAYSCFSGEDRSKSRYSCSERRVRTTGCPMTESIAEARSAGKAGVAALAANTLR